MNFPDWSGQTVVCIASGPSLTPADCAAVRAADTATIVTNTTFRLCAWADALFAADPQWWTWHLAEVRRDFRGALFADRDTHARFVQSAHVHPLYRSFGNSGACAIALAIACGARRIVMLGYDCALTGGRTHHHGQHAHGLRNCDTLPRWPKQFAALAAFAQQCATEVVNASRVSALDCFPRVPLEEALADVARESVALAP